MIRTESGEIVDRVIAVDLKYGMATVELTPAGKKRPVRRDYLLTSLRIDGGRSELLEAAERVLEA